MFQTWVPGLDILTGESPEDRIARFLRTLNGVSLSNRADVLIALVNRTVSPMSLREWEWYSNCAESAIGIVTAACATLEFAASVHPELVAPGRNGQSISRIYQMGRDLKIVRSYKPGDPLPRKGNLLGFAHGYHVEWVLSDPDANGVADHGGGGRANNAITVGHGNILKSGQNPLTEIFDFCSVLPPSPDAASGELEGLAEGPEIASATNVGTDETA